MASYLGNKIRERRKEKGLSQSDLAGMVGISRTYLSMIENGKAKNISKNIYMKR